MFFKFLKKKHLILLGSIIFSVSNIQSMEFDLKNFDVVQDENLRDYLVVPETIPLEIGGRREEKGTYSVFNMPPYMELFMIHMENHVCQVLRLEKKEKLTRDVSDEEIFDNTKLFMAYFLLFRDQFLPDDESPLEWIVHKDSLEDLVNEDLFPDLNAKERNMLGARYLAEYCFKYYQIIYELTPGIESQEAEGTPKEIESSKIAPPKIWTSAEFLSSLEVFANQPPFSMDVYPYEDLGFLAFRYIPLDEDLSVIDRLPSYIADTIKEDFDTDDENFVQHLFGFINRGANKARDLISTDLALWGEVELTGIKTTLDYFPDFPIESIDDSVAMAVYITQHWATLYEVWQFIPAN